MTRRHFSAQGTRFVHEVHPGYRHASRNNGRWHKPTLLERVLGLREEGRAQGMVRNRYGIVLLIAIAVLALFWIVALSPASPPVSPEANATTSVDGDGAGLGER